MRTAVAGGRTRKRSIRIAEGLNWAAAWKPRRHVASSLEIASFNEGGLRAAKEIIHAPDHRGPAAERAGAQLSADRAKCRHQRLDGAELPRTRTARRAQLAAARRRRRRGSRGAVVHADRRGTPTWTT